MRGRGTPGRTSRSVSTRMGRGSRKRGPGSMTKPKRRKLNQGVHETRGGSESSFQLGSKAKGLIAKIASKTNQLTYTGNANQIVSIAAGSQVLKDLWSPGNGGDFSVMMNQTLLQEFGIATPTGRRTARIFVRSINAEYGYNNNTNDQVRFQLYDIIPRQNVYAVGSGLNNPGPPTVAWYTGLDYESTVTGTASAAVVGSTPFQSRLFTTNYKVLKVTNVTLAPGQTHYHRVRFHPNKFLDNDLLNSGQISSYKGLSLNHMIVASGAPCSDSTGGVTTEAVKLLTVLKYTYEWSYVANNMTTLAPSNNTFSTATTGNIENMVTGAQAIFQATT